MHDGFTTRLGAGQALTLAAARAPRRLQVTHGRLWLTQEGDPDDHFIAAGEDLALCGPGAVVLESDGAVDAVFSVGFGPAPVPVIAQASAASVSATTGASGAAPARPLLAATGG